MPESTEPFTSAGSFLRTEGFSMKFSSIHRFSSCRKHPQIFVRHETATRQDASAVSGV